MFNIQELNTNQINLAKVLLVFYLIIGSNFTDNLLGKQMKEFINNNRIAQHVIGFLTMIVLVTLIGGVADTSQAICYALIGYIIFIFSTKLDIHWNIIIIALLFIGYMYENSTSLRVKEVLEDPNLTEEQKKEKMQEFSRNNQWIVGSVILVIIVGTILYSYKKHVQYGGGYDVFTYIIN